jgi:hypothetical protein
MKKINILWTTDSKQESNWESEYINNFLFSNFETNIYNEVIKNNIVLDNSVIVYNADKTATTEGLKKYLENYKNKKYFLFHLSDEWLFNDCSEYKNATFIFRNYINPRIKSKKVLTVPLGWKYGFKDGFKKQIYTNKKYDSCFVGQLKNDRSVVVEEIKKLPNSFVHLTESFFSRKALNPQELIGLYQNTNFVPCPIGNNNVDTFRICEILESGGLPLLKKYHGMDYYQKLFGENPIPIINNWKEIPKFYENLLKNGVEQKTQEVQSWYQSYKKNLLIEIENSLNNFLE